MHCDKEKKNKTKYEKSVIVIYELLSQFINK